MPTMQVIVAKGFNRIGKTKGIFTGEIAKRTALMTGMVSGELMAGC